MAPLPQRPELNWPGKEKAPAFEPIILVEDSARSRIAPSPISETDLFDNRLIRGDNLPALRALRAEFAGQVKCIYIDPPYNTGSNFEHYGDGIAHAEWLTMMRDRLEPIKELMSAEGLLFVQIDDREQAYLKVLLDEVMGRKNFLNSIVWQKRISPDSDSRFLSATHDLIHVYARDVGKCILHRLPRGAIQDARYDNPDGDPRGPWTSSDLTRREYRERDYYPIALPSGREVLPAQGRSWSIPPESYHELVADNRIDFGPVGNSMPRRKRFLSEVRAGIVPTTWWSGEIAKNEDGKRELKALFPNEPNLFATPKPELLIKQILDIATLPGDLVLDAFAGTGTTASVAHKMNRRWIAIESGDQCHTLIIPRLERVLDGSDSSGATLSAGWKGGGGFRTFHLAPAVDQAFPTESSKKDSRSVESPISPKTSLFDDCG